MLYRHLFRIVAALSTGCLCIILLATLRAMEIDSTLISEPNEDEESSINSESDNNNQNEIESTDFPTEEITDDISSEFSSDESPLSDELSTQSPSMLPPAPATLQVPSTTEIRPSDKFGPPTAPTMNLIPKIPSTENVMNQFSPLKESQSLITAALQKLLADEFILYTKTLNFHWNIVGIQFGPLHKLFNDQYVELANVIDAVAERIRAAGSVTHATLTDFLKTSTLKEEPNTFPDALTMIRALATDHESVIQTIHASNELAVKINDAATNNFLSGLLEMHEKIVWILRSHLQ